MSKELQKTKNICGRVNWPDPPTQNVREGTKNSRITDCVTSASSSGYWLCFSGHLRLQNWFQILLSPHGLSIHINLSYHSLCTTNQSSKALGFPTAPTTVHFDPDTKLDPLFKFYMLVYLVFDYSQVLEFDTEIGHLGPHSEAQESVTQRDRNLITWPGIKSHNPPPKRTQVASMV